MFRSFSSLPSRGMLAAVRPIKSALHIGATVATAARTIAAKPTFAPMRAVSYSQVGLIAMRTVPTVAAVAVTLQWQGLRAVFADPPVAATSRPITPPPVNIEFDGILPVVQSNMYVYLTFAGVAGFVTGVLLKVVGEMVLTVAIVGLLGFNLLAYTGHIQVSWAAVEKDMRAYWHEHVSDTFVQRATHFLQTQIPFCTVFGVCFVLGLRLT